MSYVQNIETLTIENKDFRKVLYTTNNCQLVVMSLLPDEDIGEEVHDVDQFLRIEKGVGSAILDDISHPIMDGFAIVIPAGTKHNIVNTGKEAMRLYSLYMPPHHKDGTIHSTKEDALNDEEQFDGEITDA